MPLKELLKHHQIQKYSKENVDLWLTVENTYLIPNIQIRKRNNPCKIIIHQKDFQKTIHLKYLYMK